MLTTTRSALFALVASLLTSSSLVSAGATLQGSYKITPQDYYGLPAAGLANNPPACGMPYNQLNLARITAVQNMNTGTTCNLCLKVVNSNNPSKFVYVLAVDLGGNGLDLSIPAFEYIFDQKYDASPASWSTVDYSFCAGIYTPGKVNPNQDITAGSSSGGVTTTTKKPTTTTKKPKTTTTKKHTTTKKRSTTKKHTTTKKKHTYNKKKTTATKKHTTHTKKKVTRRRRF